MIVDAAAEWAFMHRALVLAEAGRGHVEPNPLVGAGVVRNGAILGEGWHQKFGTAHAEVWALRAAGEAARGSTLYVTLEPCCHHGKTPPCTDAIIRAGISRVVVAMEDPFTEVAGQGMARLREAGITVDVGLGGAEARRQNAPYLKLLATGRPYVHLKWAMSLDGKIATHAGDSKWISSQASRHRVHDLRSKMDGILVGIGTVLADDPLLTARPPGPRRPTRVILDSKARLPLAAQLVHTTIDIPTIIVVSASAPAERVEALRRAGCEILVPNPDYEGTPRLHDLLDELGRRRWTNLLVEGGSEVLGRFLEQDAIDEVHAFIAPRLIGGALAKTPIAGRGFALVSESWRLPHHRIELLDGDVYVNGWR